MTAGSCKIHLRADARRRAAAAIFPIPAYPLPEADTDPADYGASVDAHTLKYADELQARAEFTGPHFKDCVEQVTFDDSGKWVHVTLTGGSPGDTYSYPAEDVARVKTYRS